MSILRILSLAEAEMLAAAKYYELQSTGLGHRFLNEVEQVFTSILKLPNAGTVVRGNIRRRILKRFPFAVMYIEEASEIQVVAIVDMRRRPDYWISRI
jgi:toxin ParE1/3/4